MAIRLSGLNSGLDTDSIVSALVSAYSYKKDKYVKEQTKLSWTQDAWKSLNTKVYSLYTNISNLRFSSAYNLRKTTSSDTTKATVTASNTAVNGSQKLNILQVAQSGYLTGGKLDKGITTSSTLAELGYTGGKASINVDRGDGTSSTIEVSSTSTVGNFIDQLKSAGLNASLDTTNNRIFVSAKESGADADFNLIGADANGVAALEKLGLSTSLYTTDASGNKVATAAGAAYEKYAAYASGDVTQNIKDSIDAYNDASATYDSATKQISNLTSALTYATAYANTQDFYAQYGIAEDQQTRFANVMMNHSSAGSSLVDADGNIYKATSGKDANGNTVYSYVDSNGNQVMVSREVTYSLDGKTYRKDSDGSYVNVNDSDDKFDGDTTELVKDENMNVNYYTIQEKISYKTSDEDGGQTFTADDIVEETVGTGDDAKTQYVITVDGKRYVSDSKTGTFVNEDDSKDKLTTTYTYEQTGNVAGLSTVNEAYDAYVEDFEDADTDEDAAKKLLSAFTTDASKVKSFESGVTDTETVQYSKLNIMNQVHGAYNAGGDSVDTLVSGYADKIAEFKEESINAESVMETNETVASIAAIEDSAARDEAIANLAATAMNAAAILANAGTDTGAAIKMNGQDAIIKLNGVEFTNSSNSIQVNGLTINAQAVTGDGEENAITITTATDTQGIYDKIKDFLTEYNNIINEMTKLYNASSSKGYEPLTDDEKEAMSDSEIEKWETKIKDSLLRSDSTLNGIISSMTSAMSKAIEINGKKYSLSSFGISTLGYLNAAENEYYAYHIDGDEDDSSTSGKTDKLMAAIENNPDTVMGFFQELTSNLYNSLGNRMKSTTLSSIYTIYNDKQMDNQYREYSDLISEWEERISSKEEYYYNKFSAMETALAKLNSTQSSMSGYFG